MRKTFIACMFALAATGVAPAEPPQSPVDYRFDEVKRSVTLTTATQETKAARGTLARGGDKVDTGLFSYALIASERYRAKFEIFGSTKVQLASETPGVILSLERGRLRAMFDKITGTEPRIVQTPGALLAVRGTKYDVEVDSGGQTTVDVWEGIVEVKSPMLREPMFVRAGQESVYGRREAPRAHPIPDARRMNDPTQQRRPGADDHPDPRGDGNRGPGGPQQPPRDGNHGMGGPPQTPPQAPPPKPPSNGHH